MPAAFICKIHRIYRFFAQNLTDAYNNLTTNEPTATLFYSQIYNSDEENFRCLIKTAPAGKFKTSCLFYCGRRTAALLIEKEMILLQLSNKPFSVKFTRIIQVFFKDLSWKNLCKNTYRMKHMYEEQFSLVRTLLELQHFQQYKREVRMTTYCHLFVFMIVYLFIIYHHHLLLT